MFSFLFIVVLFWGQTSTVKAGFMHIPFLPNQVVARPDTPCLSLADDVTGITAAITAIVKQDGKGDIEAIGGSIN